MTKNVVARARDARTRARNDDGERATDDARERARAQWRERRWWFGTRRRRGAARAALRRRGAAFDYLTDARGAVLRDDAALENESTVHARARVRGGHCQVPCGIFDDPAMVASLREMSATIRKAMTQINELAGGLSDPVKLNQSMRWVMTKEEHCGKIIALIGEYCLCQRVKAAEMSPEDYVDALKIHHLVMQNAMKCKQNVDTDFCCHLDHSLDDLAKMYTKA